MKKISDRSAKRKQVPKKMLTTAWFILALPDVFAGYICESVIFLIPGIAFALVWYFRHFVRI